MTIIIGASSTDIAPSASTLLSARGIAAMALQKIGAFSPNDAQPDANELARALEWMEVEIAELVETKKAQWLVPATVTVALEADEQSFSLPDAAGANYPALGMASPISAMIIDDNDYETPIDIRRRSDYEAMTDKSTSGTPDFIYIDRRHDEPSVYVYPVPSDDTLSLKLVLQTYAPSILGDLSEEESGDISHGFARGWQKWLVNQTAQAIGSGPVRRLDASTLRDIRTEAGTSLAMLMARQNRENVSMRLRRTRRY